MTILDRRKIVTERRNLRVQVISGGRHGMQKKMDKNLVNMKGTFINGNTVWS